MSDAPGRRPCLGCGTPIARRKSLPLCKPDAARLRLIFRERSRGLDPNAYVVAFNRLHGDPMAVAVALAVGA